jgi:phage recombination protein Bet
MTATTTKEATQTLLPPEAGEDQPLVTRPADSKLTADEIFVSYGMSETDYTILLRTVCKGAPREIAAFFMRFCAKKNLDPFTRQVYLWPDKTDEAGNPRPGCKWNIVAGIDGLRAIASRSPFFRGQGLPVWDFQLDDDGKPVRFEKSESKYGKISGKRVPEECRVTIMRAVAQAPTKKDLYMEFVGIARFEEFVKVDNQGKIYGNWEAQPEHQLRVRAEAMALRMAFPEEVGGIYTEDELRDGFSSATVSVEGPTEKPAAQEPNDEIDMLCAKLRLNSAQREVYRKRFDSDEKWIDYLRAEVTKKEGGPRKVEPLAATEPFTAAPTIDNEKALERQAALSPSKSVETENEQRTSKPNTALPNRPLFGILGKLGIKSKEDRLNFAADHGVVVGSFNDLDDVQREMLIEIANRQYAEQNPVRINETSDNCPVCETEPGHPHDEDCEAAYPERAK